MEFDDNRAYRGLVQVFDAEDQRQIKYTGTGVLLEGGCILTATHNFHPKLPNPMAYREYSLRLRVKSLANGSEASVIVAHADPCMDSAILGASGAHGNLNEEEITEFDQLKSQMIPQPTRLLDSCDSTRFGVWFFSQDSGWIKGSAFVDQHYPHYVLIDPDGPVTRGMSGGPVYAEDGPVVGCLLGSSDGRKPLAFANLLSACLPGWALDAIKRPGEWLNGYSKRFLRIDLERARKWGDWDSQP